MKFLTITLFVASMFAFMLVSCSGGKQNSAKTLSQEEVREVIALDSLSNELENTLEEIENSEKHIDRILSLSTQYFNEKNDGQVLLFNIDNGKFEMAPEIFDSYLNAIDGLKHMYPIKPPTYVKAS